MTDDSNAGENGGVAGDADAPGWPIALRGVTESVVTTRGPEGRYNAAALGLHAGEPVTARTWGRTRTRHNFEREREGYVQFTRDPVVFVEAALGVHETDEPVLDAADAWVRVDVERRRSGADGETEVVEWALVPRESAVVRRIVPTTSRGYGAVIEATVAASRLGVAEYDDRRLHARLAYFVDVARRCGGPQEQAAVDRLDDLVAWTPPDSEASEW